MEGTRGARLEKILEEQTGVGVCGDCSENGVLEATVEEAWIRGLPHIRQEERCLPGLRGMKIKQQQLGWSGHDRGAFPRSLGLSDHSRSQVWTGQEAASRVPLLLSELGGWLCPTGCL